MAFLLKARQRAFLKRPSNAPSARPFKRALPKGPSRGLFYKALIRPFEKAL
jgi:hypothetical protein